MAGQRSGKADGGRKGTPRQASARQITNAKDLPQRSPTADRPRIRRDRKKRLVRVSGTVGAPAAAILQAHTGGSARSAIHGASRDDRGRGLRVEHQALYGAIPPGGDL